MHFGQGKWYPGEPLPRWALSCHWRPDGDPIWHDHSLIAFSPQAKPAGHAEAKRFALELTRALGLHPDYVMPAYESVWRVIRDEAQLPLNVDPMAVDVKSPALRRQLV